MREWHQGTLTKEIQFRNGELHGRFNHWFPDGSTAVKGAYKRGVEDGVWMSWTHDGTLESNVTWSDGVQVKVK